MEAAVSEGASSQGSPDGTSLAFRRVVLQTQWSIDMKECTVRLGFLGFQDLKESAMGHP